MKKILSLVLALSVALSCLLLPASAASSYETLIAEGLIESYDAGRGLTLDAAANWSADLSTILTLVTAVVPRNFELSQEGDSRYVTYFGIYPESVDDAALQTAAEAVLARIIRNGMTDAEKVTAIHDWVIQTTTYGGSGLAAHSPVGVFEDGAAMCDGYARTVLLLCRLSHIPCLFLASTSMNHSYNAVYIDGEWLLVDATWDDPDQGSAAGSDYLLKPFTEAPEHVVDGGGVTRDELFSFGKNYYSYLIGDESSAEMTQTEMADLLYEKGLFLGTDLGYELDRAPTRAEAAVLFVRVLGREDEALAGDGTSPFTDVPAWAAKHIALLYREGLTVGQSETLFGSDSTTSARDYATFLLRAMGYTDGVDFQWETAMDTAAELGFAPVNWNGVTFTRGDAVEMTARALGFVPALS